MERREFVKGLAAGTVIMPIIASPVMGRRIAPAYYNNCPNNWQVAQKKMQDSKRPMVVFKVSMADQQQKALLSGLFNNKSMQEILSTHIFVCLSDHFCNQTFKDHVNNNVILIDQDIKKAKSYKWELSKSSTAGKMIANLRNFIYGEKYDKLMAMQKSLKLSEQQQKEIDEAIVQLNAQSFKDRRKGRTYLSKNFAIAFPVLIKQRNLHESVEVRESCKEILHSETRRCNYKLIGSQILNNSTVQFNDRAILCGMASMPPKSRAFLNQLIN